MKQVEPAQSRNGILLTTGPNTGTDTGALTSLHSDSSHAQTGQNGLLGSPGNSFRVVIILGKTVRSHYRIGVPGWAPISKACLERVVTALLEINVIMPQHICSMYGPKGPDLLSLLELLEALTGKLSGSTLAGNTNRD